MADETPQGRESVFVETSQEQSKKTTAKNKKGKSKSGPHPALSRKREREKHPSGREENPTRAG
jgi:hypothetical protein